MLTTKFYKKKNRIIFSSLHILNRISKWINGYSVSHIYVMRVCLCIIECRLRLDPDICGFFVWSILVFLFIFCCCPNRKNFDKSFVMVYHLRLINFGICPLFAPKVFVCVFVKILDQCFYFLIKSTFLMLLFHFFFLLIERMQYAVFVCSKEKRSNENRIKLLFALEIHSSITDNIF